MKYVVFYLLFINILGMLVTVYDKLAAKKGMCRVSEKSLLFLSVLGASVFMYATMRIIHHKTLHRKFMLGIPAVIFLQLIAAVILIYKFA